MLSSSITLAIFLEYPMPQAPVQNPYLQDTGAHDFLIDDSPAF